MSKAGFRNLRIIEIEIFSHCNRACSWCPNAFIDRSGNIELPRDLYIKILEELAVHGFKNHISFSRYNEPMSHLDLLLDRIALTHKILPEARIIFNTNGDYLSKSNLGKIRIDGLSVMDYDSRGLAACEKTFKECGVRVQDIRYPYIYGTHKNIREVLYFVDWSAHYKLNYRATALDLGKRERRRVPCREPKYFLGVDYNGNFVPCCNFRSDFAGHERYILGNVRDNTIAEILSLAQYGKLFKTLERDDWRQYPAECRFCQMPLGRYRKKNPSIRFQ